MTEGEINAAKPIVAMICATILGGIAMYLGIDGQFLAAIVGVIAASGGYILGKKTSE